MVFEVSKRTVLWEGIIFPGIQFGDPRFEIYTAMPRLSLKEYIHIAWLFKWNIPQGQEISVISVPTPCVKLGVRLGEKSFQAYGPRTMGLFRKMSGSGMSLGVDFVPGGLYPFARLSIDQMANNVTKIEELFPEFPIPDDIPWSPETAEDWFRKSQDFLETLTTAKNNLPQISQLIDRLWKGDEIPSLDILVEQFGMSKRSIQRVFLRETGMSLREATRITRLQKALKTINRLDIGTLTNAAMESGFFDHPHMIREFKALIKHPPAHLKKFL